MPKLGKLTQVYQFNIDFYKIITLFDSFTYYLQVSESVTSKKNLLVILIGNPKRKVTDT